MSRLSWKTEDQNESQALVVKNRPRPRKFHRLMILVSLAVTIIVIIVVYGQLRNRSARNEAQVDTDVRAAFQTWKNAVEKSDAEILNSIIVAGSARWLNTQRKLLETGLILDRKGFGLVADDIRQVPTEPRYELSDDWRWVTFYFNKSYSTAGSLGSEKDIDLVQSVGFRREGSRWIYGQPSDHFWGETAVEEYDNLTVTYPELDRTLANQLVSDLDNEITNLCHQKLGSRCPEEIDVHLILESDPGILIQYREPDSIVFRGQSFVMPSPTLIGRPVDDRGYHSLFAFYSNTLINAVAADLETPIPYPDQSIQLLCYEEFGRLPKLFKYDPEMDTWEGILPDRSFGFLSSLANDEGLLLQEFPVDGRRDHFRLITWVDDQDQFLRDYRTSLMQAFPAGRSTSVDQPDLLLRTITSQPTSIDFNLLDGSLCFDQGCEITRLDGFPARSPNAQLSLLWQDGSIALGDGQGMAIREIAEGFSPFWIDNERFGYAQFQMEDDVPEIALFIGRPEQEIDRILLSSRTLAEVLEDAPDGPIFIRYVAVNPEIPLNIIIVSRDYSGDPNRYYLFDVKLATKGGDLTVEHIKLLSSFKSKLSGIPSDAAPTGKVPFIFSPDGTMVSVSRLDDLGRGWEIHVLDLPNGTSRMYETQYPAHTFNYPYYDWSLDSQWLVIVDNGFLRLVTPKHDYERYIPHEYHTCTQIAWVND